jgi:hypothetical protein
MTAIETRSASKAIARLNDAFRKMPGRDWMITAGVQDQGPLFVLCATNAVAQFEAFKI